jgi:hypothetical protein
LHSILESLRSNALDLPRLAKFAIGMAIIVAVPSLSRRVRLPEVVGLLLAGIVLGPYVLDLFGKERPIADFLGDIGKLLLMFFAGLETDLALFRRSKRRVITFGLITTVIPLLLGTAVGLLFSYGVVTAIVIGSLLAPGDTRPTAVGPSAHWPVRTKSFVAVGTESTGPIPQTNVPAFLGVRYICCWMSAMPVVRPPTGSGALTYGTIVREMTSHRWSMSSGMTGCTLRISAVCDCRPPAL